MLRLFTNIELSILININNRTLIGIFLIIVKYYHDYCYQYDCSDNDGYSFHYYNQSNNDIN